MYPAQKSPERAFALQKYLLLHSQHEALSKHLNEINTTSSPPSRSPDRLVSSTPHSELSSFSSSPESPSPHLSARSPLNLMHQRRSGSIPAPSPTRPRIIKRRSSLPIVIDESILEEIEEEEGKLKDVNEQIKCTLTDLLNCESVRKDNRYRMWVQTRLMDTERELKGGRVKSCSRRRESDAGLY
jgi:hypothetical protein